MLDRLFPASDAQQAVRLRRFLLGCSLYLLCLPLLLLAHRMGFIARQPAAIAVAVMIGVNGALFLLFRTGLNRRFSDPSLTWHQIMAGTAVLMFIVYGLDSERAVALVLCPVLLLFGVFRFSIREFVAAAMIMLAAYAGVIGLLVLQRPESIDIGIEWYRWLVLACALPCFAVVGGKSSELRAHLRRTNEELGSALATIQEMATHDSLTGLPNRALFNETLLHAVAGARRHHWRTAVFFMDLDRFKNINDTLGHPMGDLVLKEAARRLTACAGASHLVARLGGDEFVLLVDEFVDAEDLATIAQRVLAAIAKPMAIEGREFNLTVSIGISTFPADAADAQTLVAHADIAMYRAKEQGRNAHHFYSPRINSHSLARLALEADLRRALERRELVLHFQPKAEIPSGRIAGVEALLRWNHPTLGLLLPARFIDLAEETGLIVPIGAWALQYACERARQWMSEGIALPVAVNLSARQFHHGRLRETLAGVLASTGLPPHLLELEITESMVMQNPDHAASIMQAVGAMGVRLTLDDFGTGYSSLGYLKRFPIDCLKLDRTFVNDLPHDINDVAIARAIIVMAHTLGMTVIAEGVEREEQLALLRSEGCDGYQGYLCRPPLPEDALLRFVRADAGRAEEQGPHVLPAEWACPEMRVALPLAVGK